TTVPDASSLLPGSSAADQAPYEPHDTVLPPDAVGPFHPSRIGEYIRNRPRQIQLERDSWLHRPWSTSFLLGGLFLDKPMSTINGNGGILYGGRVGWDFAPRFGMETRLGGA